MRCATRLKSLICLRGNLRSEGNIVYGYLDGFLNTMRILMGLREECTEIRDMVEFKLRKYTGRSLLKELRKKRIERREINCFGS